MMLHDWSLLAAAIGCVLCHIAAVSASVQEQNAATGESTQNVTRAASGAKEIVSALSEVAGAAAETEARPRTCWRRRRRWRKGRMICALKWKASSEGSNASVLAAIDGRRLSEEASKDVIADCVVLLVEGRVRNARHDSELLVRVR